MKTYKLKKDLPTFNAGDIFVIAGDGCLYLTGNEDGKYTGMGATGHWKRPVMAYHKNTLKHFPNILRDWFEEVKNEPLVEDKKIRRAIRAWAEAQDAPFTKIDLVVDTGCDVAIVYGFQPGDPSPTAQIEFAMDTRSTKGGFGHTQAFDLTLAELIGEEDD